MESNSRNSPKVGIVALHGAMSHAGWFRPLGEALEQHGVLLRGLDRRGCGAEPNREGVTDSSAWIDDTIQAVAEMREQVPHVVILGWCWGARLALAAQDSGAGADKLILAAPGLAMSKAVLARVRESLERGDDPFPQPFDVEDFSTSEDVRDFIREDPWKWSGQSRSFLRESRALLERALTVPVSTWPTLAVFASHDLIVDNDKLRTLLPDIDVLNVEGGHALVLERPQEMAFRLANWLL